MSAPTVPTWRIGSAACGHPRYGERVEPRPPPRGSARVPGRRGARRAAPGQEVEPDVVCPRSARQLLISSSAGPRQRRIQLDQDEAGTGRPQCRPSSPDEQLRDDALPRVRRPAASHVQAVVGTASSRAGGAPLAQGRFTYRSRSRFGHRGECRATLVGPSNRRRPPQVRVSGLGLPAARTEPSSEAAARRCPPLSSRR